MPTPSLQEIADHLGVSKSMAHKLKGQGMPITSLKAAVNWRRRKELKRKPTGKSANSHTDEGRRRGRPMKPAKPANTGDSLQDALMDAITASKGAFTDYEYARVNNLSTRMMRLAEHNKALENRFRAEKAFREEMERRQILVLRTEITDKCKRAMDAVLRRLKKLPQEIGPQCNEQEPIKSVSILQKAVDDIISTGYNELRALK